MTDWLSGFAFAALIVTIAGDYRRGRYKSAIIVAFLTGLAFGGIVISFTEGLNEQNKKAEEARVESVRPSVQEPRAVPGVQVEQDDPATESGSVGQGPTP